MLYATILNAAIAEYPVNIFERLPDTSFPADWPGGEIEGVEYAAVRPTPPPDYNYAAQNLVEGTPVPVEGVWTQRWSVIDATPEEIAERLAARREAMRCDARQARLALYQFGQLAAVEAWVAAQGESAKIEWEYANEILRTNGLISTGATALGMTEEQIDLIFECAVML